MPGGSQSTSISDRAIQILGSLAGFGALIYGVGCAILWIRYQTTGFNADEALSVASKGQIVFLGFRWIAGWAAIVIVLTVVLMHVRRNASRLRAAEFITARLIVGAEVGLVLAAFVFSTWSALTLAVDLLAITLFIAWAELRHPDAPPRPHTLPRTVVFVAVLATFSAIGWQLEVNLPYVAAQYQVAGQSTRYDGIYFGESDGDFYIAERPGRTGQFFRAITVYPANTVNGLMIRPGTRTLCTRVTRPLVAAGDLISDAWHAVEQHFRRTGQPNTTTANSSTSGPAPPPGFCPASS
jgi:hypothetical protein